MAACRKALEEGLRDVLSLPDVPEYCLPDAEAAIWEKLHTGIRVGKGYQGILEGHSKGAMRAALEFLVSWRDRRRDLRPRIRECLAIVFESPEWLRVSQLEPMTLQRQLLDVFAGNIPMRRKLVEDVQVIVELKHKPSLEKLLRDTEGTDPLRDEIKKKLLLGASTMQNLGWTFPGKQSEGRDKATECFSTFALAVSRLGVVTQKIDQDTVEEYVGSITKEISEYWPDVLCFLGTICVERRPLVSKIKFVVAKLSEVSPSFASAAQNAQIHSSIDSLVEAVRLNPKPKDRDNMGVYGGAACCKPNAKATAPSSPKSSSPLAKPPEETCETHASLSSMRKGLVEAHRRSSQNDQQEGLPKSESQAIQKMPAGEGVREALGRFLCGGRRKSKNNSNKHLSARKQVGEEACDGWLYELGEASPLSRGTSKQPVSKGSTLSGKGNTLSGQPSKQEVRDDVAEFMENQPSCGLFRMYT